MKRGLMHFAAGFLAGGILLSATAAYAAGGSLIEVFYNVNDIIINNRSKMPVDNPPFIYNGSTYVPLRFVSENLGYSVNWDSASGSVIIGSSSGTQQQSTVPTQTAGDPTVLSAIPSKTSISPGENVAITVTANKYTKSIKLMDDRFNVLAESSLYADMGETRVFNMNYTPASGVTGFHRVIAYPTDGTVMNSASFAKEFTLTILEDRQINSIEATKNSVSLNTTVKVTVYTNDAVTKVKLTNDYDNVVEESSNYSTSGNQRIFTFSVSSNRSRTIKYTAYPGSSSGYDDNIYKTVSITYGSSSSSNSSDVKVTVTNSSSSRKKIAVVTYDDIEWVEIQNSNGKILATISASDYYSSGKLEWTTTINNSELSGSGSTYYAYAYDRNNDYIRTSFTMSSSGSGGGYIYDYEVSEKYPYDGQRVTVTFYTDYDIDKTRIIAPNNVEAAYTSKPRESSTGYWTATFLAYESGDYTIEVDAADGAYRTQSFYLGVNE